jgi:geranylgeranyl diphosphate synthase type I
MVGPENVRALFKEYGEQIDDGLRSLFDNTPKFDMYAHLAYFMGFRDEQLKRIDGYGGKRFRSGLCLMLGDWYGKKVETLSVALSVELFHNFSLIHDDIVDKDTLRRGRPTVWKLWGIPHAINDGDAQLFLAETAVVRGASDAETKICVLDFLNSQCIKVIEGQHLDFTLTDLRLNDGEVSEFSYYEMIERKTADLIVAATGSAGIVGGVSKEEFDALCAFGKHLGVAYQVCDDVISIWGKESVTGKRPYNDIVERKKTLPILHAYKELDEDGRQKLLEVFNDSKPLSTEEAEKVIVLLESVNTYEHMRTAVEEHARKAKEIAKTLSITDEQKMTLSSIVDVLLPDIKAV